MLQYHLSLSSFQSPNYGKYRKKSFLVRKKSGPVVDPCIPWKYGFNGPQLIEWMMILPKETLEPKFFINTSPLMAEKTYHSDPKHNTHIQSHSPHVSWPSKTTVNAITPPYRTSHRLEKILKSPNCYKPNKASKYPLPL